MENKEDDIFSAEDMTLKQDLALIDFQNLSIDDEIENISPAPEYKLKRDHDTNYKGNWPLYHKFKFFVNRILGDKGDNEFKNHNELQGKFLGKNKLALEGTNEIVQNFRDYFEYKGTTHKRLNTSKIFRDYPEFWTDTIVDLNIHDQIFRGLSDEINYQNSQNTTVQCKIVKKNKYGSTNLYLYIAELSGNVDQEAQLQEDIFLKVIKPWETTILVLQHDLLKNLVFFESYADFKPDTIITIKYNSAWILKKLKYLLESIDFDKNVFYSNIILSNIPRIEKIDKIPTIYSDLSVLQQKCIEQTIGTNITFIWGPPGTGKTTTLSGLIENLSAVSERTLVCSISNVAVDQILFSYLKKIEDNKGIVKNSIIRAGNYYSEKLLSDHKELFSIQENIKILAKEISELRMKLLDEKPEEAKATILKQLNNKRAKLKELQRSRYRDAKTIFCTAAFTMFDELLQENTFDNLIIDEVSMMNIPYIIWLSCFSIKRIILTGDFRQLGPIAGSTTRYSKLWMKRDVFRILSDSYDFKEISAVYQLTEQYRMNEEIMNHINIFYNNKLKTITKDHQNTFSELINKVPILFKNIKGVIRREKSGSKYNEDALNVVLTLLEQIKKDISDQSPTIGIISPYREQANRYKAKLQNYPDVSIGTIHSFQGSDRDIIILDFVETPSIYDSKNKEISNSLGALFYGMDGERLITVAISRAKSKLFIIGNEEILTQANVHVTKEFRSVIKSLANLKYRI